MFLLKQKKVNILLTSAGTQTFNNILQALRQQKEIKYSIIACDTNPYAYGLYLIKRKYLIPRATSKEYIPALIEICKREKVDILIPLYSAEFPVLAPKRNMFRQVGVIIPISDEKVIKIASDKWLTYNFFRKNGIPTPESFIPGKIPSNLHYPVIIKPRSLSGSKYVYKSESSKDLDYFQTITPNPIVQTYIEGNEYTVDALSDLNGKPIIAVPRLRLDVMDGKSVVGKTIRDPKMIYFVRRIIAKLGLKGPCNIWYIRKKNRYYFTEINPRFSAGGLPLTVKAGVNTPLLLLKIALKMKISSKISYRDNIIIFRFLSEKFVQENQLIKAKKKFTHD